MEVNLHADEWESGSDRPGYAERERRLGDLLGARLMGATLYELQPGTRICPYHFHLGEEEWLLVVSGSPTVRTPEGEQALAAWDVLAFPRGKAGAHEVRNGGTEPARVMMLSTVSDPELVVYPDSGKVGAIGGWTRPDGEVVRLRNRPEANLDYFEGEA